MYNSPCILIELFEDDDSLVPLVVNEVLAETTAVVTPPHNEETPSLVAIDREPSIPSNITESRDVAKCRKYVERTCKCDLVEPDGSPCSTLFPIEHYIQTRAQANFLTHDELDLVLLGQIESAVLLTPTVIDGRHSNTTERSRVTMKYKHHGMTICRKTFLFLHAVGKDRHQNLKQHYIKNGLETCVHKNTKQAPKHSFPYSTKKYMVKFLQNYAEENALLLPGRIPGYKRDDIKLLPSSRSKRVWVKSTQMSFMSITVEPWKRLPLNQKIWQ